MINTIISALKKTSIIKYRINESVTESSELFFIQKKLDMKRFKNIHSAVVTVFRDFEKDGKKMLGSSTARINPGMSVQEIEKQLTDAYYAALFVANPFYELPPPANSSFNHSPKWEEIDVEILATHTANALFDADRDPLSFINSAEIFAEKTSHRILTSTGCDVSFVSSHIQGEYVVQCKSPEDVEMYHDFHYSTLQERELTQDVQKALSTIKDRANAKDIPPAGKYNLILSEKNVATILDYYLNKSNASMIYAKYSTYKNGESVQGNEIIGEHLNITVDSPYPYSEEGIPYIRRTLIADGKLETIHGTNRFCSYLGVPATGTYPYIIVDNGTLSLDEMKKNPYLHVVCFSDFQMDPFSGYFGGEIRLAYLFDGISIKIVTGGSVSGSLLDAQKDLLFSKERFVTSSYNGPLALLLKNISVSGK